MRIQINITVNRAIQILLLYLFAVNVADGLFGPLFSVFVTKFIDGATFRTVGLALAIYGASKSVIQVPLARFLDKHSGERDDFYALVLGALSAAIYPFLLLYISKVWHLYLLEILAGFGTACLMAAYYSLFARHVDKGSEGFEWSLFSVGALTISSAIGAAIGGVIADALGFRALFLINGTINSLIILLLFSLYTYLDGARPAALPPFTPIPKNPMTKH